VQKVR